MVRREDGCDRLVERMAAADFLAIGAPTLAEAAMVLEARLGLDARPILERFVADLQVETVPFGAGHWREAHAAFRRYGKGRHRAALNFGDCLSYALARLADAPLPYVGDDFARTDVTSA
ncbi:MAG: type II toxin-antitoxin system VapC family toxin [Thermoanaerobaculia bacterium]